VAGNKLSDAVSMQINYVSSWGAAVVTMECCGTFQANGKVTWLAEEAELLTRVKRAENGACETSLGLQVLETLD